MPKPIIFRDGDDFLDVGVPLNIQWPKLEISGADFHHC